MTFCYFPNVANNKIGSDEFLQNLRQPTRHSPYN